MHGLQVLTFCLRQPAMARDIRIQAEALFAELSAGLPPEAVKETEEMGQALDLDAAIAGVLTGMDPLPPSGDQSLDSTCPPVSAPATNAPLVGIRFERGGTVV